MLLMRLAATTGRVPNLVTQTFTANATWVAPATTSSIVTLNGKGQDGAAAVAAYYDIGPQRSEHVAAIIGANSQPNPFTTTNTPGAWDWGYSQSDASTVAATLNAGGSGSFYISTIYQYATDYHIGYSPITYTGSVPGSATITTSSRWKVSGAVVDGDSGYSVVTWYEYGTYHAATSASNGSNTTGFGFTFAGGTGGAATPATQSAVAVTPLSSYSLVIPAGGSITITYFQ